MPNLEIGLFQLESLILTRSPFLFFNLANRELGNTSDQKLNEYLKSAVIVHPDRLIDQLKTSKTDRQFPIVLVCEDGETSRKSAEYLDSKGYGHVYVVEGGLEGLALEAEASKPF